MSFEQLAIYFKKLDETSSRLSLIDILSDLFSEASGENIDKIIYLLQGRVAPFYEPVEIGMADKTVAQAMAQAYSVDREQVLRLYQKLGDMGEEAQKLSASNVKQNKRVSVVEVFSVLKEIAQTKGEGTVEKRVNLFCGLLDKLDSLSSKYLVRITLGKLRLGIGDPTIIDGLSKAKLGDRKGRKILEDAYNRTSDLGLIAKALFKSGLHDVEDLKIEVGRPIRSELAERLPTPQKVIEKMGEVDAQYKYDGFRCQIHKNGNEIHIFSRNLEDMSHMFPELIEAAKTQIKAKTAILDSEAMAYNPASDEFLPFQETTKRRRKYNVSEMAEQLPLKAFIFDLLYKNGESLLDNQLKDRLKLLKETVLGEGNLIVSKHDVIRDPKELQLMLDDALSKGLEGLVVKRLDSLYEAGGRNFNWVKLKRHSSGELRDTIDTVILGYIAGRGKRAEFGAGALLVGVYDQDKDEFVTVSKIGTGLTDEEWKEIHKRADKIAVNHKPVRVNAILEPTQWIRPEIVIEVLADEITRSPIHTAGAVINGTVKEPGYALRFPRLVSFRDLDKKPEDATTVKELIEMYNQQGKK